MWLVSLRLYLVRRVSWKYSKWHTEALGFGIVFNKLGTATDHLGDARQGIFHRIQVGLGIRFKKEPIDTFNFRK